MLFMTSARAAADRIVLVRDTPSRVVRPAVVRRYRLARLRLDRPSPGDRFAHLRRAYD